MTLWQGHVHKKTSALFESIGSFVARRPRVTLACSLIASFFLSCGILVGTLENRTAYRDTLKSSPSTNLYREIIEPNFGAEPRFAAMKIFMDGMDPSSGDERVNVLLKKNLIAALEIREQVMSLTGTLTRDDGEKSDVSYEDICFPVYEGEDAKCATDSLFDRTFLDTSKLRNMTQEEINNELLEASLVVPDLTLDGVVGSLRIETNEDGKTVAYGNSLKFYFYMNAHEENEQKIMDLVTGNGATEEDKKGLAWEDAFYKFVCVGEDVNENCSSIKKEVYDVMGITYPGSFTDEGTRNTTASTQYMAMALGLILILMGFMLADTNRGCSLRGTRIGLSFGAVVTIILASLVGFGITCLIGVNLSDFTFIIVFVVIGIGVDDIIVVVDFLNRQPRSLTTEERVAKAIGGAGPAIFLTSFTSLVAFAVASTVDFGGARWFCVTGGITIFVLFMLSLTFFTALLTFDENRRAKQRYDCFCCFSYNEIVNTGKFESDNEVELPVKSETTSAINDEEKKEEIESNNSNQNGDITLKEQSSPSNLDRILEKWQNFSTNKAVAVLIVLSFISFIPIGFGFAINKLDIGAELEDYFPDGSYYSRYINDDKIYKTSSEPLLLIMKDVDFSDEMVQWQIQKVISDIESSTDGIGKIITTPFKSWLNDYQAYAANIAVGNNTAAMIPVSGDGFYKSLKDFLEITDPTCLEYTSSESISCERYVIPALYARNIIWTDNEGDSFSSMEPTIEVVKFSGRIRTETHTIDGVEKVKNLRSALKSSLEDNDIDLFVDLFSFSFLYLDREPEMTRLIIETLVFAALAVLGTVLLFLQPLSVTIIAIGTASIDGALFVIMYLWNIPIDTVSFLCLTMSIGLSVDYVVHIAHAYECFDYSHTEGQETEKTDTLRSEDLANDATKKTKDKLRFALSGTGRSVTKGGISTFIGLIMLAFSPAKAFRVFFKMLFSTVLLGLYAGLVYFPACIILVDPLISKVTKSKVKELNGNVDENEI